MARFMDFHEDLKLPAKTASPASKTSKPKAIGALRRSRNAPGWSGPSSRPPPALHFPITQNRSAYLCTPW
jgi:hypothetical protein